MEGSFKIGLQHLFMLQLYVSSWTALRNAAHIATSDVYLFLFNLILDKIPKEQKASKMAPSIIAKFMGLDELLHQQQK
ncbi:hypothetical protein ACH5RR_013832 [Cinchona calisaya]|uniref:Uncharacterized protein n=1 Tax=Cinchona calisaya TaxID=153742 RepID=A0ABD3A4J9_9GENT